MATATPKRVDEEISLSDLHARQNSFLPIFCLPSEALENIFIHAARDYYEGDDRPNFYVPPWVNVSYVCSHWRNVALNCPTLWTYHFTVSPKWTKELLARSRHASLKIRIYYKNVRAQPWWSRLVENVLGHVERIQDLRISIPGEVFPIELSLNAPLLQILDINFGPYAPERTLMINNGDSLLLRTLKLAYCPLSWHLAFNLSGVTTLSLRWLPFSSQQNVPEFLTTLSRMQALTFLHLEHSLPSARDFLSSGAFGAVTLPRLARLSVHAPLSTVIALLSCVDIPLKTQVRLDISSEGSFSITDFAQLPPLLAQRFSQASPSVPTIRSLMVRFSHHTKFTLGASERLDCDPYLSLSHPPEKCSVPLLIRFTADAISDTAGIAGDICGAIPPTHVQTLHVRKPPVSLQFWTKTLGHLDGLRYMILSRGRMPDLTSLLTAAFVPKLRELDLYNITFNAVGEESWSDDIISERSLLDALGTRKVLRFSMTECNTMTKTAWMAWMARPWSRPPPEYWIEQTP